jgi:hypothetical protein
MGIKKVITNIKGQKFELSLDEVRELCDMLCHDFSVPSICPIIAEHPCSKPHIWTTYKSNTAGIHQL